MARGEHRRELRPRFQAVDAVAAPEGAEPPLPHHHAHDLREVVPGTLQVTRQDVHRGVGHRVLQDAALLHQELDAVQGRGEGPGAAPRNKARGKRGGNVKTPVGGGGRFGGGGRHGKEKK